MGPIIAWAFLPFSSGDDRSSNPAFGDVEETRSGLSALTSALSPARVPRDPQPCGLVNTFPRPGWRSLLAAPSSVGVGGGPSVKGRERKRYRSGAGAGLSERTDAVTHSFSQVRRVGFIGQPNLVRKGSGPSSGNRERELRTVFGETG